MRKETSLNISTEHKCTIKCKYTLLELVEMHILNIQIVLSIYAYLATLSLVRSTVSGTYSSGQARRGKKASC